MNKIIFISLFFILSIFDGCRKKDEVVPNVYVNFSIDLGSVQYLKLATIGGWVYVTGGVNGIIIYHNSVNEFAAYDRTCPYHPNENNRIYIQTPDNIFAYDSVCHSRFSLLDGLPESGPAKAPLKYYNADYIEASNMLHVYNQ